MGLLPAEGGSLLRTEEGFALPPLPARLLPLDAIRLSNFLKLGFSPNPLAWLSDPKCSKICGNERGDGEEENRLLEEALGLNNCVEDIHIFDTTLL